MGRKVGKSVGRQTERDGKKGREIDRDRYTDR
jgi:hypothetical protein